MDRLRRLSHLSWSPHQKSFKVDREAYQTQHRLHKPLAFAVRLRSVVILMGVDIGQGLESTHTTSRILADGNGIEDVGSEMWR